MRKTRLSITFIWLAFAGVLAACSGKAVPPLPTLSDEDAMATAQAYVTSIAPPTATPTPTPLPPRVLSVCAGQEPASLFLYADDSRVARMVRQAIYDGPVDWRNGEPSPVILERIPSLESGDVALRPVQVSPGELIADALGNWVALAEGVAYRPAGCTSPDCARTYSGDQPVEMEQLVVRFRLRAGLAWADGVPLTAQDAVYGYQVAARIFGNRWEMVRFTAQYTALDEVTVEWAGIPGYQGDYRRMFFTPLPQHLWGAMTVDELFTAEISARLPLGWGAYRIVEWIAGDHITLDRNPYYFRAAEGLPAFDHLVIRFMPDGEAAVDALLVGECDLVDATALGREQLQRLAEAQDGGQIQMVVQPASTFEHIIFGIQPLSDSEPSLLAAEEMRRALAQCIDRPGLAQTLYGDLAQVAEGFYPPGHLLAGEGAPFPAHDPQAAAQSLAAMGWVEQDGNADAPRMLSGTETRLQLDYLIPDDAERRAAAEFIRQSLASCGVALQVNALPWEEFLQPGPDGPVFGRRFEMAQFAWGEGLDSPCGLYLSSEIPGPYPDYPKGWGGGNIGGFADEAYDLACRTFNSVLPDSPQYTAAAADVARIFAAQLPVLPLYWRLNITAARPDVCLPGDVFSRYTAADIEFLDSGQACVP